MHHGTRTRADQMLHCTIGSFLVYCALYKRIKAIMI